MVSDGDGVGRSPLPSRQVAVQESHVHLEFLQFLGVQLLPAEQERILGERKEGGRNYYEVEISVKS